MLCQHVPREEFGFSFTCDLAFLSVGERQRGERVEKGSHMFSLYTTTVAQCSLNNTSVIHLRVGEERFHWLFGPDGLLAAYYTTPTAPERGPILSHLGIHLTLYISTWSRHYFSLSFLFFSLSLFAFRNRFPSETTPRSTFFPSDVVADVPLGRIQHGRWGVFSLQA